MGEICFYWNDGGLSFHGITGGNHETQLIMKFLKASFANNTCKFFILSVVTRVIGRVFIDSSAVQ